MEDDSILSIITIDENFSYLEAENKSMLYAYLLTKN